MRERFGFISRTAVEIAAAGFKKFNKALRLAESVERLKQAYQGRRPEFLCAVRLAMVFSGEQRQIAAGSGNLDALAERFDEFHALGFMAGMVRPFAARGHAFAEIVCDRGKTHRQREIL